MARSTSKIIVMPKLGRVSRAARRPMHPTARLWAAIGMIYLLFMLAGVIWSTFSNSLLCSYLDHLTVTGAMQRATDSFKRGEIRKQAKALKSSRLWTAGKQVTSE